MSHLDAPGEEALEAEVGAVEDVELGAVEDGGEARVAGEGLEGMEEVGEDVDDEFLDGGDGGREEGDGIEEDAGLEEGEAVHDDVEGGGLGAGSLEAVPAGPHGVEPVLEEGDGREQDRGRVGLAADHAREGDGEGGPVDEGGEVRGEGVVLGLDLRLGGRELADVLGKSLVAAQDEGVVARAELRRLRDAALVGAGPADEGELVAEAGRPAVLVPGAGAGAELAERRVGLEEGKVVRVPSAADDRVEVALHHLDGLVEPVRGDRVLEDALEGDLRAGELGDGRDDDLERPAAGHVSDARVLGDPGGLVGAKVDRGVDALVAGAGLGEAAEVVDAEADALHR
mmetsp:Transcript_18685/g.58767  ORF Transcript_18685/g.58767 Transcript_18685/m.58767 type:complete len:342 (+) Transcript_18685:515-1540(+)